MTYEPGTTLTCMNPDCGCHLRIEQPCPHGDSYTCACGSPFQALDREPISLPPS